MNAVLDELTWRGFIAHSTDPDALRAHFDAGPVTFYVGFDPTAPSIHMGNLVQLMLATRQRRVERDTAVQHGSVREDRVASAHGELIGGGHDAGVRPLEAAHGLVQQHVLAQALGQAQRNLLQTPDHALVEDEVGVDEVRVAAGRGCHEERFEQRDRVGGLGEHAEPVANARFRTASSSSVWLRCQF